MNYSLRLALGRLIAGPVVLIATVPFVARGQGIPDRVAALEAAVANLQNASSTLQNQLAGLQGQVNGVQTRVSALESSSAALQTRVSTLESNNTALQNKVVTIQNQIAGLQNEQSLLTNTVTGLQNQNQVYIARNVSPITLDSAINFSIVNGVSVPAGTYLIHAIADVTDINSDDQSGECFLSTEPGAPNPAGGSGQGTPGDAIHRIKGNSGQSVESWQDQLPLIGVASFSSNTTITLSCRGFHWEITSAVVAVGIGGIHRHTV